MFEYFLFNRKKYARDHNFINVEMFKIKAE